MFLAGCGGVFIKQARTFIYLVIYLTKFNTRGDAV